MRVLHVCMVALVSFAPVACLFTDLSGLSTNQVGGTSNDGAPDVRATSDDATSPAKADTGTTTPDARAGDAIAPSPDAGLPCSDPGLLIGVSDTNGLVSDTIPPSAIDTYPYVAVASGKAQCVWLWIDTAPPSKQVRVGIYHHDNATNAPTALRGDVVLQNVQENAWNSVAMTDPIELIVGDKLWLGMSPIQTDAGPADYVEILVRLGCVAPNPFLHIGSIAGVGDPPSQFIENGIDKGQCDAAIYLGR